jgi:hypothetical protein
MTHTYNWKREKRDMWYSKGVLHFVHMHIEFPKVHVINDAHAFIVNESYSLRIATTHLY